MRLRIPIEEVRVGDLDPVTRKRVVDVLHRFDVVTRQRFVRATLEDGWPLLTGYYGHEVEIERGPKR